MSKLSLIVLLISLVNLIDNVHPLDSYEFKRWVYTAGFLTSAYFLFLDLVIFILNPYSLRVKVLNLVLETVLGGLYDKYKGYWSFKWLNLYCNQLIQGECYYEASEYVALCDVDQGSVLDTRIFLDRAPIHRKLISNTIGGSSNDPRFFLSFRSGYDHKFEISWDEVVSYNDGINSFQNKVLLPGLSNICRHFEIGKFTIIINTRINLKTDVHTVYLTVVLFDVLKPVLERVDEIESLEKIFGLYYAWQFYENHPECGIINTNLGGSVGGTKYLHCHSVNELMDRVKQRGTEFTYFVHHVGRFCVAGDGEDISTILKGKISQIVEGNSLTGVFSSPLAEVAVGSYLSERYPTKVTEISNCLRKSLSWKFFDNSLLNNWQRKRMFLDIKVILSCFKGCSKICADDKVRPSEVCKRIVKSIKDEGLLDVDVGKYTISKWRAEDLKRSPIPDFESLSSKALLSKINSEEYSVSKTLKCCPKDNAKHGVLKNKLKRYSRRDPKIPSNFESVMDKVVVSVTKSSYKSVLIKNDERSYKKVVSEIRRCDVIRELEDCYSESFHPGKPVSKEDPVWITVKKKTRPIIKRIFNDFGTSNPFNPLLQVSEEVISDSIKSACSGIRRYEDNFAKNVKLVRNVKKRYKKDHYRNVNWNKSEKQRQADEAAQNLGVYFTCHKLFHRKSVCKKVNSIFSLLNKMALGKANAVSEVAKIPNLNPKLKDKNKNKNKKLFINEVAKSVMDFEDISSLAAYNKNKCKFRSFVEGCISEVKNAEIIAEDKRLKQLEEKVGESLDGTFKEAVTNIEMINFHLSCRAKDKLIEDEEKRNLDKAAIIQKRLEKRKQRFDNVNQVKEDNRRSIEEFIKMGLTFLKLP